jgi:hypothetical protein
MHTTVDVHTNHCALHCSNIVKHHNPCFISFLPNFTYFHFFIGCKLGFKEMLTFANVGNGNVTHLQHVNQEVCCLDQQSPQHKTRHNNHTADNCGMLASSKFMAVRATSLCLDICAIELRAQCLTPTCYTHALICDWAPSTMPNPCLLYSCLTYWKRQKHHKT